MPHTNRRDAIKLVVAGAATAPLMAAPALAQSSPRGPLRQEDFDHLTVRHRTAKVDGLDIFYREAGRRDAPAVLLLHGFPTSSHMFRHLIPALADRYRVIAPDYPGFGYSSFPARDAYRYSFANIADTIARFTDAVGLGRYALFVQDYGAPIGFRIALQRPDAIRALIVQNGNIHDEGLSPGWAPIKAFWADPSPRNRGVLAAFLSADGTRFQYAAGVAEKESSRLSPDSWTLDWARLQRPGNVDVQIDLLGDYRSNVELYPRFQRFLRDRRPPTLILWGKNDPFFTLAGAHGIVRELPTAELELVDASHFLLETHGPFAAERIRRFLAKSLAGHRQSASKP